VLDCALELHDARHGERVQVHHGTRAVPARLAALDEGLWQLRLESALLVVAGDRVVVRRLAPPDTLGGGVVLDALARRHGRRPDLLRRLHEIHAGGPGAAQIRADRPGATPEPASGAGDRGRESGRRPKRTPAGAGETEERVDERALDALQTRLIETGLALLSEAQLRADAAALRALRRRGRAVRVAGRLYADADVLARARADVIELIEREGPVALARARDVLKTSRKSAQAILEHMDAARLTRRLPDDRRALAPRSRQPR
jgi:selenocysteine-specific elongation factor